MFRDKVFKKSLFGYSKIDVISYLNDLSQDFSKRLLEQEENTNEEVEKLQERIIQLELENKDLLDKQNMVANILMDAEKYNSSIKKALEYIARKNYEDLLTKAKDETKKLNDYKTSIDKLRSVSQAMLENISKELEYVDVKVGAVEIPEFEEFLATIDSKRKDEAIVAENRSEIQA